MITGPALRLHDRFARLAGARWTTLQGVELPQQSVGLSEDDAYWEGKLELARDPARGHKIDPATIEEAAVAVHAESSGVLRQVEREKSGHSEFTDWQSRRWDVKSPISPPLDKEFWVFDVNHEAEVVQHEVQSDENVLLNLTRCTAQDAAALCQALLERLPDWQARKVLVLAATAPGVKP
ncbi:MAG: hypothetical protein KF760_00980 [Candidatus Eremiobacteraeota bacterium]|nr:hypothetical protein [Candidatus Eremiobacteraeota bacterium]MCW5870504.1 hypothetical protein [Candidatus Eremiobacteraeota bacterium]